MREPGAEKDRSLILRCGVWDRRNKVEKNGFPTSLMLLKRCEEENGAKTDTEDSGQEEEYMYEGR